MKNAWICALFATAMLCAAVNAESGLFNYGTVQPSKLITVEPGGSAVAKIFVFNVHGNRPTHVHAEVLQVPTGFTVKILPETHSASYNISGAVLTNDENLVVEPVNISALPQQKPDTEPEGGEWITMGGIDGFIPAKVIYVNVTADAGVPLWTDYPLTVTTSANWYDVGAKGPVSMGQARDFDFTIRTVTTQYSEEQVATPTAQAGNDFLSGQNLWFYSTVALVLLVVALAAYTLTRKPSKR